MYVIKMGGAAGIDADVLCEDVAALWRDRQRMVLVHGGSDETNRLAERLGSPPRFVTSVSGHTSRVTDREMLEIFSMATALINRRLVERLQSLGVNAIGLSGVDGRLIEARRKAAIRVVENNRQRIIRDDWTGTPQRVNATLLQQLLDCGYLPVVAPLGLSASGEMLNIDGDRAAAIIAGSLRAEVLLLLTNVAGLLRAYPDESTLIRRVRRDELESVSHVAAGRMRKKIMGASEALTGGVARVIIGDGRRRWPIAAALSGEGTVIE
jgi:[amino group carrier protein]-L-2-aminoadipate 6-kinase